MKHKPLVQRIVVLFTVAGSIFISGCGAFVLANPDEYRASVNLMRGEMQAAADAAKAAALAHDRDAHARAVGRVLNACGDAERLAGYGEAAVKSYYGQQSSNAVLAQIAQAAYERNCRVDGQDRLREEGLALQDSQDVLREACGCPNATGYVTFGTCQFSEAAWDDFMEKGAISEAFFGTALVSGAVTAGVSWIFMGAGLLFGMAENVDDKLAYCEAVHERYTRQYRTVASLKEQCAAPPRRPARDAPMDAEALAKEIEDALNYARSGSGNDMDGSDIYGDAWQALQECNTLSASLGIVSDRRFSEVDTHVDQEPGELGEYEIPDYTPPPETPPPPPGGG